MPSKELGEPVLERYHVVLQVQERIMGGVPKSDKLIEPWLTGRGNPPEAVKDLSETVRKEVETVETERAWTTFKGDDDVGYYIEGRQIKAMLKDAAKASQATKKVPALLSKLSHGLEVQPQRIYISKKDGGIDGFVERPVHAMTARGPRTSLKRMDYIERPTLDFTFVVGSPDITEEVIRFLMEYAQTFEGLGASVSQGEGKFDIVELEKVPLEAEMPQTTPPD